MSRPANEVVIARFGRSHGVKGWVHVQSFTDPDAQCLDYDHWQLQDSQQTLVVTHSEQHAKGLVVKIEGIDTPEDAREQLTNRLIVVEREQLKPLPEGEGYYWHDLIGCEVLTKDHQRLGVIDSLFNTPGNDVAVVVGDQQHLIPWLSHTILDVDLTKRQVYADWDPNL